MAVKQLYRASTIKRIRRTNAQLAQLDTQILAVLEEDHPQAVRHVFYRMTDPRLSEPVEKSDRGYRHVQERCVQLRRAGRLPYAGIADMSRRGYFTHTYDDASDFLRRVYSLYRADIWRDAPSRCEVWCESRSIASVIMNDCDELAVDLYPCGGFSSLSFVYNAAAVNNSLGDTRPLWVFYIGDYDPAGVLIDQSLESELRRHLESSIPLIFMRIAINKEQIEDYDLPEKPRKAGDKRSQEVKATVEAEAMPAHVLRSILRDWIERLLPEDALRVAKVAEESERAHLLEMAEMFGDGDGPR